MHANGIKLYAGFDAREEYGFHTFVSSAVHRSSVPLEITPIGNALLHGLCNGRRPDESTDFARARFLIPWLERYVGWAMFCDGSDMIVRGDLAELWAMRDMYQAVMVVKHDYRTRAPRKFLHTEMESDNRDYPRKNWSSVMLINCAHFAWRDLTPDTIRKRTGSELHQFKFMRDDLIGELPAEWNWLAQEFGVNPEAQLVHYTLGIPAFSAYVNSPMANEWAAEAARVSCVSA
jgi:hypothetical protein